MNEPRVVFGDGGFRYQSTFRFYDDRIECDWRTAWQSGKKIYPVSDISGRIGETMTFGFGLKPVLRTTGFFLLVAVVLHLGFNQPFLNRIGYLFYFLGAVGAVISVVHLKKDRWLYVLRNDGRDLFGVREKGLKDISPDIFVREVQRYAILANQSTLPTPANGTSAADAPVAPPPGAAGL